MIGLPTDYQTFIHQSRYARWLPEEGRRETWAETVKRTTNFWMQNPKTAISQELADELFWAIHDLEVMPSMRVLMTAGEALERDNVAGFNCSYIPIDDPLAFTELMYILLCGTGVGFSVERQYINQLPEVADDVQDTTTTILVEDSKVGWCEAFKQLVALLYVGQVPQWDVSRVRPAGAPLKTFGGRASGPEPLEDLFRYTIETFKKAAGRKLSSLEVHDLVCKIADVIVVGGVRRSALISLSNPSDQRLRSAKSGQWWDDYEHRGLANNSACYTEKPEFDFFMNEVKALYDSKSGERGIFSRVAAQRIAARNGRRDGDYDFGTNPCSEIILRPNQFCNLSEVVVRAEDTLDDLRRKVRVATILGTLQATLTDFRFLRPIWKKNTEEEALLGVSLTGIMDNAVMAGHDEEQLKKWLKELRNVAIDTNEEWAARLGIHKSAAITCVKPSGTVSQLVDAASGIHPRFSRHYIRTVRADKKDPLAQYMVDAGFPNEESLSKPSDLVFSFPVESPADSVTVSEVGAMEQLRVWKLYQDYWCEHKPSITVYYKDNEFFDICSWMWKNFDSLSGISLLPYSDHTYRQAPYTECSEDTFREEYERLPSFDLSAAAAFENGEDSTTGTQELACAGGACEIP